MTANTMKNSMYIEALRREYAMMVLMDRAIPSSADGVKAAARRIMWMARDGAKYKAASLAGITMAIHPHATPDSTVQLLAATYINNCHLLTGYGDFGTLLSPKTYGAARYTSVKISDFAKDAFMVDLDIIPMKPNYDHTQEEPVHFLPLVPMAILNPSDGIAFGFAADIFPRRLSDVITQQINHLKGKPVQPLNPYYAPYDCEGIPVQDADGKWVFKGAFTKINSTTIRITKVPPTVTHVHLVGSDERQGILNKLLDSETIIDYTDDSKETIDITVKFKRGTLDTYTDERLLKMLGLSISMTENLNLIDMENWTVMAGLSDTDVITKFTDWRLKWYIPRYERLLKLVEAEIRRYLDILIAIKYDAGTVSKTKKNRAEYIEWLSSIGVHDSEYVSSLPTYRYTIEEREKIENSLREAVARKTDYQDVLANEDRRRDIFISDLQDILKKHGKKK